MAFLPEENTKEKRIKNGSQTSAIFDPKINTMYAMLRISLLLAGFMFAGMIQAQQPYYPDELVVSASVLNLRDQPDKSGKVVEKMPRGTALRFLEIAGDGQYVEVDSTYGLWLKVQSSKNNTGYVFSAHILGAINLYMEGDYSLEALPALPLWYGVYARDSFSDELRPIRVRMEPTFHELFEEEMNVLRTDQPETAKFILGTTFPLRPGFAGNLGIYEPGMIYMSADLAPGNMLPIYPGQEPEDTSAFTTRFLGATGCARFDESDYVRIEDYRLFVLETRYDAPALKQELTPWVQTVEGMNPAVSLYWYGDLDGDRQPDAILQDTPQEMGTRLSLFLSSKARPGAFLHKVCEYTIPID